MTDSDLEIGPNLSIPASEIQWRFSRASAPGGQNVNKTATRVELLFDVAQSPSLTDTQKKHVLSRLGRLIDQEGVLHIYSQASSSQWQNRQDALARFRELLAYALRPTHARVHTRPSRTQKARRREEKSRQSQKKQRRRPPPAGEW